MMTNAKLHHVPLITGCKLFALMLAPQVKNMWKFQKPTRISLAFLGFIMTSLSVKNCPYISLFSGVRKMWDCGSTSCCHRNNLLRLPLLLTLACIAVGCVFILIMGNANGPTHVNTNTGMSVITVLDHTHCFKKLSSG